MLAMPESLFVEKALSEVRKALKTLQQFNSCISVQKFITIFRKTDKQNSKQLSCYKFLISYSKAAFSFKESKCPRTLFYFYQKGNIFKP